MRICDRWMQEGTTDRHVRSHPPQCTTSRADRQIVRMAVTDRSVTSRTVAQHIQSLTHHPVSARTIRRRLQQSGMSARCLLLRLPLTQNHRRLRRQWCDERKIWTAEWNEIVFTEESRFCLQHHDGRIRFWRNREERMLNSCVMHRHTGPTPGIMVWGSIGYHYRTPLVRIADCRSDQFDCKSPQEGRTRCIPIEWTCDARLDCKDGSDEKLDRCRTAHRWYENVEEKINSWDTFVKMFSQNFGHHVTQKDQLAENLKTRAQGKEETSDSYIQDVLHLCREVNPAMMENEIVAHLTKGISEEIYQSIIILDIASIDEFIKWCRKIEASNKKRVKKRVVFDRLPNVAAIDSADSESMEDLIRRIVREEVHRALNPESTTPEPSSLKEIIREEIEKKRSCNFEAYSKASATTVVPQPNTYIQPGSTTKKLSVASSFEGEAAGVKNPPSSTAAKLQQNYVEIIIDDIAFSALVDSGSSFSVISDGLRRQLKKTMFKDSGMTLKVADGKNVTSIGRCTISLSINGLEQPLEFIVLPNSNPSIILGWDFLEASNAVIDCGRAEIRLEEAKDVLNSPASMGKVVASRSVVIPAESTKLINVMSEELNGQNQIGIKKNFQHTVRKIETNPYWISVLTHKFLDKTTESIFLLFAYLPPNVLQEQNLTNLLRHIDYHMSEGNEVLIAGDINIRIGNAGGFHNPLKLNSPLNKYRKSKDLISSKLSEKLISFTDSNSITIANGRTKGDTHGSFTFISERGSSVLDYFMYTHGLTQIISAMWIEELSYSDHLPIVLQINTGYEAIKSSYKNEILTRKLIWTKENVEMLKHNLSDTEVGNETDINTETVNFTKQIYTAMESANIIKFANDDTNFQNLGMTKIAIL
ncbi:hypothetical protein LAZ67_5003357 [Cordylochernes scorpioides]|uniref:Uncharacterized protein n=1 Tax=Cordylochernes scorpioides TaxID=51811 RepID=A0ABY6KIE0_9ARAC|nr:hypothetical protein LAZ67_5003357 [Cordylochernes scorpioides]